MHSLKPLLAGLGLLSFLGTASIADQVVAQPSVAARTYAVGPFDKVAAAGSNLVVVHVGGVPSVRAEGSADTLDRMEVVVEHDELQIRPRREFRDNYNWNRMRRATFTVTAPRLAAASLAGAGTMRVDRAIGDRFAASVAGSGNLDLAAMRVGSVNLSMAGSGNLSARGTAGRAVVSVAGSGNIHTRGVTARTASVSITGSGTAELTALDAAHVSIVGSGDAQIAGRAHCIVSRIGSGAAPLQRLSGVCEPASGSDEGD
jgi:hypothetical protein